MAALKIGSKEHFSNSKKYARTTLNARQRNQQRYTGRSQFIFAIACIA
jgi:hypothetical protein